MEGNRVQAVSFIYRKNCFERYSTKGLYEHFLVLSVASSILISPALAFSHRDYAKQLMKYFVEQGRVLYGDEFLVYNVHSMLHLADVVREFGCMQLFPFRKLHAAVKKAC